MKTTILLAATTLTFAACQTTETGPDTTAPTPAAPLVPETLLTAEDLFPDREILDYTIQPGDSLWLIAENHKIPVADLRNANAIAGDDNKIIAGKTIRIPLPAGSNTATPEQTQPTGQPVNLSPSVIPDDLTPSTLPGIITPPPTNPIAPPDATSGLPAPPSPPQE
ncbi:MAG: LysM peptidoglycan-binding domain-containing protein [Verrucomicrobiales bacterium]|nr:LysM peptidoglycan-binding domain-containing protein [Verrucomicrobiales bacterium]